MNSNEIRVPVDIERFKAGEPIYGSNTGKKYSFVAVNQSGDHFCAHHLPTDVLVTFTLDALRDYFYMKPKTVTKWRAIVRNKHGSGSIFGGSTLYDSEEELRRAWDYPDVEILECSPVTFPVD
jgi:hypothetical protein